MRCKLPRARHSRSRRSAWSDGLRAVRAGTRPWRAVVAVLVLVAGLAPFAVLRLRAAHAQDAPRALVYLPLILRGETRDQLYAPQALAPAVATRRAATATEDVPPSATPGPASPTSVPTDAASPTSAATSEPATPTVPPTPTSTPEPTATATPDAVCSNVLYNGDFEEGASRWAIDSTYRGRSLSGVILHPEPNIIPRPVDGEWLAQLGGGRDGGYDELSQPRAPDRPWSTVPEDQMVSATLNFSFAVFTELIRDRRPDDTLSFLLYDVSTEREYPIENAVVSEESGPDLEWRAFSVDVTRQMTSSRGEKLGLKIRSQMREVADGRGTNHFIDAISLEVCTKPAP